MKVRIIEIEGVTAAEATEALARFFPERQQLEQPVLPEPVAILPPEDEPSVRMQLAKTRPGWRPSAPPITRKRSRIDGSPDGRGARREDPSPKNLRPTTEAKFMCGPCGGDMPEGKDRRSSCPKCGSKAWEKVPARSSELAEAIE